jgi:hypothetical protein
MHKVLSKKELDILLLVPTTVEQAAEIDRRFGQLLAILNALPTNRRKVETWEMQLQHYVDTVEEAGDQTDVAEIKLGCPHCDMLAGKFRCHMCAYGCAKKYLKPINSCTFIGDIYCTDARFGGVSYRNLSELSSFLEIDLHADRVTVEMSEVGLYDWDHYKLQLQRAKRWSRGHIEWANEVIKRDGVPWPDGYQL